MQKSEFSIRINLSTATLTADCWCLWTETTPQLWMSSRFMYLHPFKHSLKVHASWVATFTLFNHSNPDHYCCTCSAELCHTAIIPWRGKKINPNQFNSWPSQVTSTSLCRGLILTGIAGLPQHGLTFPFSSTGNADTQVLSRQGSTKWSWAIVLLGSAASDLLA